MTDTKKYNTVQKAKISKSKINSIKKDIKALWGNYTEFTKECNLKYSVFSRYMSCPELMSPKYLLRLEELILEKQGIPTKVDVVEDLKKQIFELKREISSLKYAFELFQRKSNR